MKKTKFITVLILIAVIAAVLLTTIVACKPKGGGNSVNSGEIKDSGSPTTPSGSPENPEKPNPGKPDKPKPGPGPEKPEDPVLSRMDVLNKIIEAVEIPDKALNLDVSAKAESGDTVTTINLKGNFYSEVHNELCFAVYQQKNGEKDSKMVFAVYIVNEKIYIDLADGSPLIYLSDFDFNYLLQIIKGAGDLLPDLVGSLVGSLGNAITDILDLALDVLLGEPKIVENDDKSQSISMELDLKTFLESIGGLLGFLPFEIPVDIEPIVKYLASLIPDQFLYINAKFKSGGELESVGLSGADKETEEKTFDFVASIALRETAELDIGLPDNVADMAISEFSFTNLKFSIDLVVESEKDANGEYKNLDVGKLINGFLGTSTTMRIPEGLLLLNGGTGIRLAFQIDLDLNYDKLPVDNNKVAIELYLINPDGTLAEALPQIGLYYTDGSFYLNTDNMLPNYLNGLNIKLDANLSDLVDKLVNLITDAIDKVFGLDFAGLRKSELEVNDNGSINLSSMSAVQKVLINSDAKVVALSKDDNGGYKLSAGIGSFVDAIANLLGMGGKVDDDGVVKVEPNIFTDDTSIKVIVNNNFFEILSGLIPQLKGVKLPEAIGDIVLSINTSQVGLDSITIDATINNTSQVSGPENSKVTVFDPALGLHISLGQFLIGFKDAGFADYINGKVNADNKNYLNSLNSVVDLLLGGIRFSSSFKMNFDAGTYDFAPFIAGFGVPEVEASQILWKFDNDFVLDASLNLQIALNRTDTAKSMIVLEMKTESGIKIGDHQIIEKDQVLLGIYGYNNNIYIDISHFNIAGIVLPKLSFSLNFTDLVYTLLDNVIDGLLKQIGEQSGDLKFEINFKELFGLASSVVEQSSSASAVSSAGGSTYAQTKAIDPSSAIILAFTADKFVPSISLAAILAILNAANTDIGNTLAEALNLMEIDLSIEMGRKDGFIFSMNGEIIPKLDENGESVYYYDEKGELIPKEEGKIYKNILLKPAEEEKDVVYYTSKKYNYGSNMKLLFEAGTEDNPVIVGNLGTHKYPIEDKAKEFTDYKSDLIDAIVGTVGKASVNLDIDLRTFDNEMNVTRLINSILANFGKKLELPISLNLDDWNSHVQLSLAWDLDLTRFSNSKIMVELKYEQKNILGIYIHRNSIIVDLTGLGLFSGEIVNSNIVSKVFAKIDGLIKNIGSLDLNDIINDLLKNAGLPTVGTKPEDTETVARAGEEVAADGSVATIGEGLEVKDFIEYLTKAIHLENTAIVVEFTSSLINSMLNDLVGLNLGLNLGLDGKLDIFGDSFDLGLTVEDIEMDLKLSLSMGKDVEIPIDFDDVPDWDATSGTKFAETLLNNLDIGFTIDLANYTNDVVNMDKNKDIADNFRMYTRISIFKVLESKGYKMNGVKGTPTAPQGSFVVKLARIKEGQYNDTTQTAGEVPLVYVVLDHRKTSGQLTLALCANLIKVATIDIGNEVGIQNIDLDLLGMLGPVIDNLFSTIDKALDGNNNADSDQTPDSHSTSESTPTPISPEQEMLNNIFAELDIIKLLGENGIMLNLRANGTFNATINFDPYLINKLLDDVMSMVFAKNTGHGSILNLKEMAPDMFDKDYMADIAWTRETYGTDNDTNTFWGSLRATIVPLLQSLLRGLGQGTAAGAIGAVEWMLGDIYSQVRKIVTALLPFAVWNTATLEVNIVDATLSNIHFRGQDLGQDIHVDNDESKPVAYSKDKNARGGWTATSGDHHFYGFFFTEIFIYNTSNSVGGSTADGTNNGLVTWADIPTDLTFMPYIYSSVGDGADKIFQTHFKDKVAIYQKGTTIMRAKVDFQIINYNNTRWDMNKENLEVMFSRAGKFQVEATARFSNGVTRTLTVNVESRGDGGGIKEIEDIEMHAYDDSLPDFLTVHTNDGNSRKINTEYLQVTGWRPNSYKAHEVTATVKFGNGESKPLIIHYLDSTVDKIIIDGTEGKTVNVDLYEFDLNSSKIEDFTPKTLYFKYLDGKAVGLDVLNGWDTSQAEKNLFNRKLDVNGKYSTDVSGGVFTITSTVAAFDGRARQDVELKFAVKSKKVYSLTINGAVNTINIDPYKYYMYMIGESEENPFPDVVEANYYDEYANPNYNPDDKVSETNQPTIKDEYDEDVNVVWTNLADVVFNWNNNNDEINKVDIALDNEAYPNSSFTWTYRNTQVAVLRNEVEKIFFDEKLTQTALIIDPFKYLINGKGVENFPDHAYVQFTNGAVYYMPIAWKGLDEFTINPDRPAQFRQFEVVIGFDPKVYNDTGVLSDYSKIKGTLLQETCVNVQVEDRIPKGIELVGSELVGGTYYIDPIQVLYYGMNPFPSEVTVRYMSGKTSVLEVSPKNWIKDFNITMKGLKSVVKLQLNDQISFDVNVEIIDRRSIKSELTSMSIDPYIYTIDEKGNRVYDVYEDNMNLYQSVGTIDLETFSVVGRKQTSGAVSEEYKTFLKYVINYERDGKLLSVTETDIDYIKDFVANNQDVTIVSTEVIEFFNVPIKWDFSEINYSVADTYPVRVTTQASDTNFNTVYKVMVEVRAKKVVEVIGDVYYIMVGGTNLSETAKLTQKLTLSKLIKFDDESTGTYEVTLDLTKVDYSSTTSATLRWEKDANGNLVVSDLRNNGTILKTDEEIKASAMDIEVTVCSGDIAQKSTMKVHVLDNRTA